MIIPSLRRQRPHSASNPIGLIKLGVDVHLRSYVVARQVYGLAPQWVQSFSPEAFIAWVAKQMQQADVVHCCYEASPFGFGLHRLLRSAARASSCVRATTPGHCPFGGEFVRGLAGGLTEVSR